MWRAASSVGCSDREEIVAVRDNEMDLGGGERGGGKVRM